MENGRMVWAIRCGLEVLPKNRDGERFAGLLALRTVAAHLDLAELHDEIDAMVKANIAGREEALSREVTSGE